MGDRHGGCFARRGRALNPPHPHIDAHRGVGFRWRARAKEFAPREKALLGESLPTRRTSERICPAQEHAPRRRPPDTAHEQKNLPTRERSPRRRPPDTAHERKDLPHAGTLSSAKASRHGARAKGFARARTLPSAKASRHGARAKGFARARTLPSAKASRHGARAKEFAPRRNTPHGEGLPTRRKGKRICPAREHAPWRRPPDTAHERKDLPRAGTRPAAKASRHGARAKGFAPAQGSRSPHVPTNGGPPPSDGQPEKHPFGGVAPERARPLPSSFTEKKKTTP